jgi:tRNA A-37 threonylcarbamoyl transferase component Bud32
MRRYDTQALRHEGRNLSVPFQLSVGTADDKIERTLTCTSILRHLPGKRLVCSGTRADGAPVVAKVFLDPSAAERHYRRELKGIEALQTAEIPTPELLFEGRLVDGQAPVLLFREMRGFLSLAELLEQSNAENRLETLRPAVKSIARLHVAGLKQRDIHPANFLLSGNRVMIIDGDDIEKMGAAPLHKRDSLSNLSLFFAQFHPVFDAMVPPLMDVYCNCRQWAPQHTLIQEVNDAVLKWRAWRLKRFLAKTRRSCTAFIVQKQWRRFMACDREWYSPACQPLLDDLDAFIEGGTILKAGNSATVSRITIDGQAVVVKRYNIKSLSHALRRGPRPSRAMVSWENAHRLRFWGINTPQPLAVIEERWGTLRKRAYFIMAYQPGETIDEAFRRAVDDPRSVDGLLDQLGDLLKQLAVARISHGDCKATNFLLSSNGLNLVDLDGMRAHCFKTTHRRSFRRDMQRLSRNWQDLPQVQRGLATRIAEALEAIG